jgi:uncharacterized membrane protein
MRLRLAGIGLVVLLVVVGAPLVGWPPVVRLPAVLVPALVLVVLAARPARFEAPALAAWQPSRRLVWCTAVVIGLGLFWYILTRFRSGQINAIDFTVYFDRPCFQTAHGRPLMVEASDTPGFSDRSELADHAYWGLLPLCSVYALHPTPLWLHVLSALAVVMGAVYTLRILQRLGASGALACATALAFVLNDNTARTLNYGFHPEVLYAWFVPWMIDAGLRGARGPFLAATLAAVLVKEDACLPLFAASVGLGLHRYRAMTRADRVVFLVLPTAAALVNLAAYYHWVVPMLTGVSAPWYARFWDNYGDTPSQAAFGMMRHPRRVMASTLTSGVSRVLAPHLWLPFVGWRWALGIVPIVLLYGASSNAQLRGFGIYYAIVLVPFLILAASEGALTLARRLTGDAARAQLAAAGLVLLGALLVGSGRGGYSLRPWRAEIAAMPEAVGRLGNEPLVLVQSGLYPHAGYDPRFQLLTPETLRDPRHAGAVLLLARRISAFPFSFADRGELAALRELPPVQPMPDGLFAVRLPVALPSPLPRPAWPCRGMRRGCRP